jgi:two-component system sensor histidine kinase TctE
MAEAVRSAPSEDAARSRAGELLKSARHAKDLANKLLTLERASSGEALADTVDLAALLMRLSDTHRARMTARSVALSLALPVGQAKVQADPVMLEEAVTNLIDNALLHGGAGLTRVDMALSLDTDTATIRISDDGVGIAPDEVDIALARFGQPSPSEGSGLGLSIAEAVANKGGGSLTLSSSDEGGLEVALCLPLAPRADQRPAA